MKQKLICKCAVYFLLSLMLASCNCGDEENVDVSINQILDIGGAGDFMAINMATNDTLKMNGGIDIYEGKAAMPKLDARNGNIIKIVFVQNEKYKDYTFNTVYTLHNRTEIKDKYQYEYAISNTTSGQYSVGMIASYHREDDKNNISISSSGTFLLNVIE